MLADRIAIDYRKAGLTRRQVCMLEYAMLVSRDSESGACGSDTQCNDVMYMAVVTLQYDCFIMNKKIISPAHRVQSLFLSFVFP
jgi:hypothetical protein